MEFDHLAAAVHVGILEQLELAHVARQHALRRDVERGEDAAVADLDADHAERMSRMEALRSYTLDAAYAGFLEDQIGSLEAGVLYNGSPAYPDMNALWRHCQPIVTKR